MAFRLSVLNPGGRDPDQDFAGTLAGPEAPGHAPVNFHAYAACTGGGFLRETASALTARQPVLLLLRGDFREAQRALAKLQAAGLKVAVSLKETGLHQIAAQLANRGRLRRFLELVRAADGCLAPTPEAADIYRSLRGSGGGVAFIPTPYPLEEARWDFSRPVAERQGIFLGTREWDVPSRNHFAALALARSLEVPVTVYDFAGRKGKHLLGELGGNFRVLTKRGSYADYLRVVAQHRIVLQMDTSFVPGQVAGDALLCRVPCVGGNGAIDRLGHPETCGAGRSGDELRAIAQTLLTDDAAYGAAVTKLSANERLGFNAVAGELEKFYAAL